MDNSHIWLIVLCVAALLYGLKLYWQNAYSTWEMVLYLPAYLLGRLLWRVQFTNDPPEEMRRGAVLAANHRSSVDPFFIQLAARRRVHWMVAKEYCTHPILGLVLKTLQVIPTNRTGTDTIATRIAMDFTAKGKLVGMFPEGKINTTRDVLLPVRAGAALVAIKSGVPIIPLYIQGSPYLGTVLSPFTTPANVKVTFGDPIYPNHEQTNFENDSPEAEPASQRTKNNLLASHVIMQWGQTLAKIARCPQFNVQVGGRRGRGEA